MKKGNIKLISVLFVFLLFIIALKFGLIFFWEKKCNKFDYNSSKKATTIFLEKHKKKLEEIGKDIYQNRQCIEKPYKNILSVCFNSFKSDHFKDNNSEIYEKEYVIFSIESQGIVSGGQYYGLIYSVTDDLINDKKIQIFDEYKETGEGNNIFIREKISENWYFYYDDYDGKVNLESVR